MFLISRVISKTYASSDIGALVIYGFYLANDIDCLKPWMITVRYVNKLLQCLFTFIHQ